MNAEWAENPSASLLLEAVALGLEVVFRNAHDAIKEKNRALAENSGTTLTACIRIENDFIAANIGDTRFYLISETGAVQLSIDDSWLAQQIDAGLISKEDEENQTGQNLLTRCIGIGGYYGPHIIRGHLEENQILCICSDGFYKKISDAEMIDAVSSWYQNNENPLSMVLETLFERGETDNISVALMS